MATKFPPPKRIFIRARHHGGAQTPKAVVLHGTVSSDNKGTALNIANWWNSPTSPVTSAHYVVDPGIAIQCVGDHTVAYHCGYNQNSVGVEFCDEQVGPASRWQDADSKATLKEAAILVAELCLAYGIEVRRPSIAELKAKGPHGIYGHNDSRLAFGYTTHSDPLDFPWKQFLRLVRREVNRLRDEANHVQPKLIRVDVTHHSMQFSDTDKQQASDAEKLFARAEARKTRWITGTETGPGNKALRVALKAAADRHGYRIDFGPTDTWIAVRKAVIKGKTFRDYYDKVIDGIAKRWSDKGVHAVTFEDVDLGTVTVIAGHYLTKGRPDAKSAEYRQNLERNRELAKAIGDYASASGRGKSLVFYGGDQNIVDRGADTFFGEPLTSLWDELDRYENTGHGNIDVIASYDEDGRVRGAYCRVLDDSEFHLHTDHWTVDGGYDVRPLAA